MAPPLGGKLWRLQSWDKGGAAAPPRTVRFRTLTAPIGLARSRQALLPKAFFLGREPRDPVVDDRQHGQTSLAAEMVALIEEMRASQNSIGGIAEVVASGVPAGLGEPVFDKLDADLGDAVALRTICLRVLLHSLINTINT